MKFHEKLFFGCVLWFGICVCIVFLAVGSEAVGLISHEELMVVSGVAFALSAPAFPLLLAATAWHLIRG